MYYGVEKSTDMRYPQTQIKRFRSKSTALKWAQEGGGYTYADPEAAQNWHHTLRRVYEMPSGWRPPSREQLREEAWRSSTPTYPRNWLDMLARHVHQGGIRVEKE